MMVQARPGRRAMQASASVPSGSPRSRSATAVPCTCRRKVGATAAPPPRSARRARRCCRLARTASGSSPTWSPRFNADQAPRLTPPGRAVHTACTWAGAGQSGRSQPSGREATSGGKASAPGIGACGGMGRLECRQRGRGLPGRHGARQPGQIDLEALRVEDLRHQAASRRASGHRPSTAATAAALLPPRARASRPSCRSNASRPPRAQWRYQAVFSASSCPSVWVRYLSTRRLLTGWISQATIWASARTWARPSASPGSSGGCGCVSSRYSMIAIDCTSVLPSSSSSAGTSASPTRSA